MATVPISSALIERITHRIEKARDLEIQTSYPAHYHRADINYVNVSELHNRLQWGEHYEVGMQLPRDWVSEDANPYVRVTDNAWMDNRTITTTVQFREVQGTRIRPSASYYNRYQAEMVIGQCEHLSHLPGYAELLDRLDQAKEAQLIADRWGKVKDNLLELLNKCRSLNEAVKLQPTIKAFLSSEDVERLEKKAVRPKRDAADILAGLDLDAITTGAVLVRLG